MASVCCDSFSIVKLLLISLVFLLWITQGSSIPHRRNHFPDDFSNSFDDDVVSLFFKFCLFWLSCWVEIYK